MLGTPKRIPIVVMAQKLGRGHTIVQGRSVIFRNGQDVGGAETIGIAKVGFVLAKDLKITLVAFDFMISGDRIQRCRPKEGFLRKSKCNETNKLRQARVSRRVPRVP